MELFAQERNDILHSNAERALRESGMDCVGLYVFGKTGVQNVVLGLNESVEGAYRSNTDIDPVLQRVLDSGAPTSTFVMLGERWTTSELYQRVSGRFGVEGFASFPLYRGDKISGILSLGVLSSRAVGRLDYEGLSGLSPLATLTSLRLLRLPRRHPELTQRQNEVAELAARGLTNVQIAEELGTGTASVRKHMKRLNEFFQTATRTAMAAAWQEAERF